MISTGERAYSYAKACGIIGKSFVGKRIATLGGVSRLSELDRLVFPDESRDLPEKELLLDLEARITARAVKQILQIVDSFLKPPTLLSYLIRTYEYTDLKTALKAIEVGDQKPPAFTDIGHFRTVHFEAYPDLAAMVEGSEFGFLLKKRNMQNTGEANEHIMSIMLDRHYYASLWNALLALPPKDRVFTKKILFEEISLRNVVWALRLRTYYGMTPEQTRENLISLGNKKNLVADAEASLRMALDNRAGWNGYPRAHFLNPETPNEPWTADPRYFQNAASKYLYRLARLSFRRQPFSLDMVFCFIKLKLFEEDLLTSMAEGLVLGMSSHDVLSMLEVPA
ncbi:MAG: V-type ATPase subunit [Treponema sp.]|jgi:vacuolar-type H+-ATPase subunit C/Vma6|nr:V-type ATPase subunit [Treponema sp.]